MSTITKFQTTINKDGTETVVAEVNVGIARTSGGHVHKASQKRLLAIVANRAGFNTDMALNLNHTIIYDAQLSGTADGALNPNHYVQNEETIGTQIVVITH